MESKLKPIFPAGMDPVLDVRFPGLEDKEPLPTSFYIVLGFLGLVGFCSVLGGIYTYFRKSET